MLENLAAIIADLTLRRKILQYQRRARNHIPRVAVEARG